jgi:hypothetical protein
MGYEEQATTPIIDTYESGYQIFSAQEMNNKYLLYQAMMEKDPEVYGAIKNLAVTVAQCYGGVMVKTGASLEKKEKDLQIAAQNYTDAVKMDQVWYALAKNACVDGDVVFVPERGNGKITEFRTLPMKYLTILEEYKQTNQPNMQVFHDYVFILNERSGGNELVYVNKFAPPGVAVGAKDIESKEAYHIKFDPADIEVLDLQGRVTYGVYSESMLKSLKTAILWKTSIILDDIVLRHRLIPKLHWKLDLSSFQPDKYPGDTYEAKVANATTAAKARLKEFKDAISPKQEDTGAKFVDQDYITSKEVEGVYVEPRTVTYKDPNDLVEQINLSICAATGVPSSALTGNIRGTYASELIVSSYASIRAKQLAVNIKNCMEDIMREEFRPEYGDLVDELHITLQLILDKDRAELARQISLLAASGCFTVNEIRQLWGLPAKDDGDIIPSPRGPNIQTPGQVAGRQTDTKPQAPYPDTPQNRDEKQKTV